MKVFKFVFILSISITLFILLNNPLKGIPPLGKFLSPHQGYLKNAESTDINFPTNLKLKGLQATVSVVFDSELIPHITAKNEQDLYFVQGYITAYHRLWQMEMQLYKTAGRISEILGPNYLKIDRDQRRKGLVYGAKRAEEELEKDPELHKKIKAYADGVNAYIDQLKPANYPIEYKLLNYKPEPWSVFKVCLLLKEMADQLSRGEQDLAHTNALKMWGMDVFNKLYPESFPTIDPVIPRGTKFQFDPIKVTKPNESFPLNFTKPSIEDSDPRNGSNSFVVNSKKTSDGSVILANEPDLGLNLPSIWYLAHLTCPGTNVMGATLPGSPGIVIGFNDSIAWGNTNAKRDLVDWYYISFKNDKREEYQYDDKWLKTQKVIEQFKVKGGEDYYDTIIFTHYGPTTYDRNFPLTENKEINLAMRWTAHDPSREVKALDLVNRAKNYQEFVQAFTYFTGPPQNYSFSSASGDIALWIHGKFPVKWEGQGKFLMDGRKSSHEWAAFMPMEHNYFVKNPTQNFVSSANQHPGDSTYPYYDFDHNWEYYRNRRINERLNTLQNINIKDMMKLQNDNFNYMAFESLPMMIDMLDSTKLSFEMKKELNELKLWDYFNNPDLKAPTFFELWWNSMYELIWDEFENKDIKLYKPSNYNTYYLMKNDSSFSFFDRVSTPEKETLANIINLSFGKAYESLQTWKSENGDDVSWYKFKNTRILHLLQLKPFSVEQVKIGGNNGIVNAASERHGPSWRMIVQFKDNVPTGYGVYPGSQTGNPGNPTYAHMIDKWAQGEYYELNFKNIPADKIKLTSTLNPN